MELTPGSLHSAHRPQLQPHVLDLFSSEAFPLHYFHGKAPDLVLAPEEYIPERYLDLRMGPNGVQEVLVKWQGYTTDPTWEPLSAFFSPELKEFCDSRRLKIRMTK